MCQDQLNQETIVSVCVFIGTRVDQMKEVIVICPNVGPQAIIFVQTIFDLT